MQSDLQQYLNLKFQDFRKEAIEKKIALYGKYFSYHNFLPVALNSATDLYNVAENTTFQLKVEDYSYESYEILQRVISQYFANTNKAISICSQTVPSAILENLSHIPIQLQVNLQTTSKEIINLNSNANDEPVQKRLATIEAASRLNVPVAVRLQVGLGEEKKDILNTLLYIREISDQYKLIQSVIITTKNTSTSLERLVWTIAMARLALHEKVHITVIPNSLADVDILSRAGADDFNNIDHPEKYRLDYRDLFFNYKPNKNNKVDIDLTGKAANGRFKTSFKKTNWG